jgi:hypothetical protein
MEQAPHFPGSAQEEVAEILPDMAKYPAVAVIPPNRANLPHFLTNSLLSIK